MWGRFSIGGGSLAKESKASIVRPLARNEVRMVLASKLKTAFRSMEVTTIVWFSKMLCAIALGSS